MCERDGSAAVIGDELEGLLAAVERVGVRGTAGRSPAAVGEDLIRLRHAIDLLELAFAADAARFAGTDEYDRQGSVSPIAWIRHECHMGGGAAAAAVCVGDESARLPESVAALEEGKIGFGHLALLAGTARALAASPTGGGFAEGPLLRRALRHSVSRFRHDCAHARHAGDAEGFLAEEVAGVEARRLELEVCGGGGLLVRGLLDPVGGALLRSALAPLAAPRGGEDERCRERRYADALVELAGHGLDRGLPGGPVARPHLQVTATLETLLGLPGAPAGELEGGAPIAAATVGRIACDASVTRVLLGPDSAVVDVGRARRVPSGATRRALALRDRGCVWPGCERPPSWTEAHHLRHWARGGLTEVANLVLVCHRHHWLVHEGGWQLVRAGDGRLLTIPPLPTDLHRARAPAPTAA